MKVMFLLFILFLRFLGLVLINLSLSILIPTIPLNLLFDLILFTGIVLVTFNIKFNE